MVHVCCWLRAYTPFLFPWRVDCCCWFLFCMLQNDFVDFDCCSFTAVYAGLCLAVLSRCCMSFSVPSVSVACFGCQLGLSVLLMLCWVPSYFLRHPASQRVGSVASSQVRRDWVFDLCSAAGCLSSMCYSSSDGAPTCRRTKLSPTPISAAMT